MVKCISLCQTGFGASTFALKGGKGITSYLNCENLNLNSLLKSREVQRAFVQLQSHSDHQIMTQVGLQHEQEPGSVSQKG